MKTRNILGLALAAALVTAPVYANEGHDKGDFAAKKLDHMKKELVLTDEQASQIKGILETYVANMKQLKQQKHDQISAVLTAEQRQKYEKMKKKHQERWEEKKKEWKEKHGKGEKAAE